MAVNAMFGVPVNTSSSIMGQTGLSAVMGQTLASAVADMTVDFWQDFEFAGAVNTTNLAANDHNPGGTWAVTDTMTALTTNAAGVKDTISNINGSPSNSTLGLRLDSAGLLAARLDYTFASAPNSNPITDSCWVYVPSTSLDGSIQLRYFFDVMKVKVIRSSAVYTITLTTSSNAVTITPDAWYWVTVKVQRNATCSMSVYDSTGAFVGSTSQTGANNNLQFVILGDENTHSWATGLFYFDNWVINYSTAPYPLGP